MYEHSPSCLFLLLILVYVIDIIIVMNNNLGFLMILGSGFPNKLVFRLFWLIGTTPSSVPEIRFRLLLLYAYITGQVDHHPANSYDFYLYIVSSIFSINLLLVVFNSLASSNTLLLNQPTPVFFLVSVINLTKLLEKFSSVIAITERTPFPRHMPSLSFSPKVYKGIRLYKQASLNFLLVFEEASSEIITNEALPLFLLFFVALFTRNHFTGFHGKTYKIIDIICHYSPPYCSSNCSYISAGISVLNSLFSNFELRTLAKIGRIFAQIGTTAILLSCCL